MIPDDSPGQAPAEARDTLCASGATAPYKDQAHPPRAELAMVEPYELSRKCLICRVQTRDDDLVSHNGGWYHARCAESRTSAGVPAEAAAILCTLCLTGIASAADLDMSSSRPTHIRCVSALRDASAA